MEKMFCLGIALGMLSGALIVANNYKARALVKKSQREAMDKVDELLDEKLKEMGDAQNLSVADSGSSDTAEQNN